MGSTLEKSWTLLSLYQGLIADPNDSALLQQGIHAGPALAAEERQIVMNWLKIEMSHTTIPVALGTKKLSEALVEAGACMTEDDWKSAGLDALSTQTTKDGKACSDCHSTGEHGVFVHADPAKTFEENRHFPIISRWVKGEFIAPRNELTDLVPTHVLTTYGANSCDPTVFECHPAYELPPALAMGIETFTTKFLGNWRLNACPPL